MKFLQTAASNLSVGRLSALLFAVLYTTIAAIHFTSIGNNEFLGYITVIVILIVLAGCILAHQCVPAWILWLLSTVGLLHMLGASVIVNGDILYNYVPWYIENPTGLTILKFDQIVHMFGSGVAAVVAYFFLLRDTSFHWLGLFTFAVLASMGVGAVNEMIEFMAKMSVPDTDVGGYYNTSVDLVSNFVGALVATTVCVAYWKRA